MPRASNTQKSSRPQKPHRKTSNALGYAKRKSLKAKTIANPSDVYEYHTERVRRSKVKMDLEKDEISGARAGGKDDEAEDDEGGRDQAELKPRLVGEDDDDEGIADDEDEDIDSDAAFDESDEEQFAGFGFSQKKTLAHSHKSKPKTKASNSKGVHFADVDLNEDSDAETPELDDDNETRDDESAQSEEEEEEEEGDSDEFIDVLDILDGRGEPDSGGEFGEVEKETAGGKAKDAGVLRNAQSDEDEDDGMDQDDDESNGSDEDEDEDEDVQAVESDEDVATVDDSALQNLESFITGLDAGTKRKAPDDSDAADAESAEPKKRKRRLLKEQTQVGAENEFATQTGSTKLNLDDLLAPLASSSSSLLSLKKSAKVLASSSSKSKTLAAPLPQRTQERLDREAAYEQTKEEVHKWSATMKRIKEAEHLSFPLQAEPVGKTSNLELMAKFKPTTVLESAVDRLLKSAKMREEDIAQTETLKMNHLSVEEVAERRAELAKMRELMFRNEAKAKRIAKIKSKTYHRLKKREKAKLAAKLGEDGEDEDDEEGRMKMEMNRARERATLRHKNTGKWAKAMRTRGELDEDQRREIGEMLDRGEKLRRRIQGHGSGDETSDEEDAESLGDGEDAAQRIKASAFDELAKLREADDETAEPEGKKGKSVFEMNFMKDAMLRDKHRADRMADDFVKELVGAIPDADSDNEGPSHIDERAEDTATQRVGGRVSYRPGTMSSLRAVPSLASDTSSVTLKSTDLPSIDHPESPTPLSPVVELETRGPSEPSNPWLALQEETSTVQKKHELVVSKTSATDEKSKHKLRKRVKKRLEEQEKTKADATVDISMSNVMTLGTSSSTSGPSQTGSKGKQRQTKPSKGADNADADDESDVNSEVDEQEAALTNKGKGRAKGVKAFEQRELVARAFAGDNVVREFEEAKQREIQEDAPKEVDMTLPGWGSWGGLGTKKAPPKPYLIKKIAGVDPSSRADYHKAHVIISEKRDKKAAKYLVKDLPYPYTSKAQFERNMDTPIGSEWNTRVGFQRGTLPKVVKKMGAVITPLEKLL